MNYPAASGGELDPKQIKEKGTYFTFPYSGCEVCLNMIDVLHAETVKIRCPRGTTSCYCMGGMKDERF